MTDQQIIETVTRLAFPSGARPEQIVALRTSVNALLSTALERFSRRVAAGPHYTQLQKDFTHTPVAGIADLLHANFATCLFDFERSILRVTTTGEILTPTDDVYGMKALGLSPSMAYYGQVGTKLRFLNTDGSLLTFVTPVTVMSNYVAPLADVRGTVMEKIFIETLWELVSTSSDLPAALKAKVDTAENMRVGRA